MKRAAFLIILVAIAVVASLSAHGSLPFVPVLGPAMEPELSPGSLLMVEPVMDTGFDTGDIIVFRSPEDAIAYYNYPPVVARRILEITASPSVGFITGGDATGTDPFTVRPVEVLGTAGSSVPFLGLPMLFFQSRQDMILVGIAFLLLALFLYRNELLGRIGWLRRWLAPEVITVEKRPSRPTGAVESALEKFAGAMADYARHLSSHTSAIQGLSEASHELKRGAAEQNKVLAAMLEQTQQKPASPPRVTPPAADTAVPREPAPVKRTAPAAKRPVRRTRPVTASNEKLFSTLLKNIHEAREASAAAPSIPEVSFIDETRPRPAQPPQPDITPEEQAPRPVPGCARRTPWKGGHPHAS